MKNKKPDIICFAGCDWWFHNRGLFCPQIMMRLKKQYSVLFVNNLGMRIPSLKKDKNALNKIFRKLKSMLRFLRKVDESMYVVSPVSLPLFGSTLGRKLNTFFVTMQIKIIMMLKGIHAPVFYIGCPPALEVARKLNYQFLIYERTDLFEEMPGTNKAYIASLDKELMQKANLVLYVNKAMWEEGKKINDNSLLLGHGVDYEFFANALDSEQRPEDIVSIRKPIVGFFGDVSDKTSDIALLEFVAKKMPDISLVFVGAVSADVSSLRMLKNVHFLGKKSYDQIPLYGKEFDICIMPWNQNKWIQYCNPVKMKEYLALGKPIVSMYYPEIEPYRDVVYVARDYDSFVLCIQGALEEKDPEKKNQRQIKVRQETWDNKARQVANFIDNRPRVTSDVIKLNPQRVNR